MSAAPASRTFVATQAGLHALPRARVRAFPNLASKTLRFGLIVVVTHFTASLSGYVLLENARKDGMIARDRATEARQAEAVLRKSVDALTSFASIKDWTAANGFVAPDAPGQSSVGVVRVAASTE